MGYTILFAENAQKQLNSLPFTTSLLRGISYKSKPWQGAITGIRHSSTIGMFPVIDGNEIDNLLLFIREENQPVAFRDPCGLFTMQRTGEPPTGMERVFRKPLKLFTEFSQGLFVTPDMGEAL
jgi:hypothetical protein